MAADYEHSRTSQLAANEPTLRRSILTANDEADLQPLLDEAYPLPSDRNTPGYAGMQQASARRAAVFEKQDQAADAARQRTEAAREARLAKTMHTPRPVSSPADAANPADSISFTAHGFANEAVFLAFYRGDFDKISFGRDDVAFGALASGYMSAYWDGCQQFLTENRTPITRQECTGGYSHWVNQWGVQTSPDTCNGWSSVPTGNGRTATFTRQSKKSKDSRKRTCSAGLSNR